MKIWYIDAESEEYDLPLQERLKSSLDGNKAWVSTEERTLLESDTTKRQVIPYIIFGSLQNPDKVFTYQRGKAGSENRLHSKYSIGVGGHVEQESRSFTKDLLKWIRNEVEEELGVILEVDKDFVCNPVTYLISSKSEVDKVHIGLVYMLTIDEDCIIDGNGELGTQLVNYSFKTKKELKELDLEEWSNLCLGYL